MLNNKLKKLMAVCALVGLIGSTTLASTTEAASPSRGSGVKQSRPINNRPANNRPSVKRPANNRPVVIKHANNSRRPVVVHRRGAPRRYERESHSDTGNLVTGLIIGGVIGAIVANNS